MRARRAHHTSPAFSDATHRGVVETPPAGGDPVADDDTGGPDSYIRFTAPEDKEYAVYIHDHLKKGGPDYFFRIEVTPVAASTSTQTFGSALASMMASACWRLPQSWTVIIPS